MTEERFIKKVKWNGTYDIGTWAVIGILLYLVIGSIWLDDTFLKLSGTFVFCAYFLLTIEKDNSIKFPRRNVYWVKNKK